MWKKLKLKKTMQNYYYLQKILILNLILTYI